MIKINITSVPVNDQDKALDFYTNKLGFVKKAEINLEEGKWLTVVSPQELNGVELFLELTSIEPARVYQKALKDSGIPWTSFEVDNLKAEYERLISLGVEFSIEPREAGAVLLAVLDDTCGNYIQLIEML